MKKVFRYVFFALMLSPFVYFSYLEYKVNSIPLKDRECCINYKCCDPLENKYDSNTVIFNDKNYSKKNVLKVIKTFGPLEFRKENGNWITYSIYNKQSLYEEQKYELLRIPLDSVYTKLKKIKESIDEIYFRTDIITDEKYIVFSNRKNLYLNNVVSVGSDYVRANGTFKWVSIKNKEFEIKGFTKYSIENGNNAKAIVYNTTDKIKKDFKIKIRTFDKSINGKLMSEDVVSIDQSIQPGQMKVINFRCNISTGLKKIYAVDVNIID